MTSWRYLNQRFWLLLRELHITDCLSDKQFARAHLLFWLGKFASIDNPLDFNEKLKWLMVHYRNPLMQTCADKYAVRKYVEDTIGGQYLNGLIGVYNSAEEIDFDSLPNRFVLKANHGSAMNLVCNDKSLVDWPSVKKTVQKWLRNDFSRYAREWQYQGIPRKILCEKFLEDNTAGYLRDYKLLTFHGDTKYIWVDHKDINGRPLRSFYNPKWEFQREKSHLNPTGTGADVPRPDCLDEMLMLAKKLAHDFPQCRVDFYVLDNRRIIFGEMTFSSAGGCNPFCPDAFCRELGDYIEYPNEYVV